MRTESRATALLPTIRGGALKVPVAKAETNDPVQRVIQNAPNKFTISGVANAQGFVPSYFSVKVGGKTITINQTGGDTPADVAQRLAAKMPKGFHAELFITRRNDAPVSVTITKTTTPRAGGKLMSPVAFAKANLAKGTAIKSLMVGGRMGGGGPVVDLLKNPKQLEKYKVGEYVGDSIGMAGPLKNTVYVVSQPGPNDAPVNRVIVRVPVVQPNDAIEYRYVDVGILAKGGPKV